MRMEQALGLISKNVWIFFSQNLRSHIGSIGQGQDLRTTVLTVGGCIGRQPALGELLSYSDTVWLVPILTGG